MRATGTMDGGFDSGRLLVDEGRGPSVPASSLCPVEGSAARQRDSIIGQSEKGTRNCCLAAQDPGIWDMEEIVRKADIERLPGLQTSIRMIGSCGFLPLKIPANQDEKKKLVWTRVSGAYKCGHSTLLSSAATASQ